MNRHSIMDCNEIKKLQLHILEILKERNWDRLQKVFTIPAFIIAARSLHEISEMYGANILHIAIRNWPMKDIIERILAIFPETLKKTDGIGRTPLHVAAGLGISYKIIITIAVAFLVACMMQDLDGRTPLHYAADSSFTMYEGDESNKYQRQLSRHIILALVLAAPSSILLEDYEERNAI